MIKQEISLFVFSIAFLTFGSIDARAQQVEVISEDGTAIRQSLDADGVTVIEQFQSGDENFMPSPKDFRKVELKERAEKQDRSRRNISTKLSDAVSMVESMLDQKELLLKHGFLPEQFQDLEAALETYGSNMDFVSENMSDIDSVKSAKVENLVRFFRQISGILEPHQVDTFKRWNDTNLGLAKVLLKTEIGDEIQLTDSQRSQIEATCQRLSDEIVEFVAKQRKEAFAATDTALTSDQKDKLEELISVDKFQRSLLSIPLSKLNEQLDFRDRD